MPVPCPHVLIMEVMWQAVLLLAYDVECPYTIHSLLDEYIASKAASIHSAGWSSLVARRAHNPKVVGSNPAPATNKNTGQPTKVVDLFAFLNINIESLVGQLGANNSSESFVKYQRAAFAVIKQVIFCLNRPLQ